MSEEAKTHKTLLLCLGAAVGKGNRRMNQWVEVDEEELKEPGARDPENRERLLYGKFEKHAAPGQIFRVDLDDKGTIHNIGNVDYVGLWPYEKDRVRWQAASDAVEGKLEVAKQKAKDRREDPLLDLTLREIVKLYNETLGPRRAQMLQRIVHHLAGKTLA